MAEPFVFHFSFDEQRRPQIMVMVDLECACTLCGHPQLQRFYHGLPYHALTWAGLKRFAKTQAHQLAGYECENCGDPVGAEAVLNSVTTYGFADHAGEVLCFVYGPNQPEPAAEFQLKPGRRLDPQVQPVFRPDESLGARVDDLSEMALEVALGRPFSIKIAALELLKEHLEQPESVSWAQLAPGLIICAGPNAQAIDAMLDEAEPDDDEALCDALDDLDRDDAIIIDLADSAPLGLATYEHPEALAGQWRAWIAPYMLKLIDEHRLVVWLILDARPIVTMLEYTFKTARLTYTLSSIHAAPDAQDEPSGHTTSEDEVGGAALAALTQIKTPRDGEYSRAVTASSVAYRAAFTGVSGPEAARQTAEEIVGLLLRLWS